MYSIHPRAFNQSMGHKVPKSCVQHQMVSQSRNLRVELARNRKRKLCDWMTWQRKRHHITALYFIHILAHSYFFSFPHDCITAFHLFMIGTSFFVLLIKNRCMFFLTIKIPHGSWWQHSRARIVSHSPSFSVSNPGKRNVLVVIMRTRVDFRTPEQE